MRYNLATYLVEKQGKNVGFFVIIKIIIILYGTHTIFMILHVCVSNLEKYLKKTSEIVKFIHVCQI